MSSDSYRLLSAGALLLISSTSALAENLTPDLQFNGYATAGMAQLSNAKGAQYLSGTDSSSGSPGITQSPTAEYDTVAGLQFKYRLNDQTDFVTQLLASSEQTQQDNYSVKANWAYIAYHANDDFTFRAGRIAYPTYLFSENLHVGEAYPWARLPTEIYATLGSLYSMNGFDMLYRHAFGDWNLTVQPTIGEEQLNNFAVNGLHGLTVNFGNDNLTLHAGSMVASVDINLNGTTTLTGLQSTTDAGLLAAGNSQASVTNVNNDIAAALNQQHVRGSYSDAGALYDDGNWFAATEFAQLRFAGYPQDFNSAYGSVGHYFGKWLPYVLYAQTKTVNTDETMNLDLSQAGLTSPFTPAAAVAEGISSGLTASNYRDQSTLSLGARYQLKSNVSVKMQVDRISNFHGSQGLFYPASLATTLPPLDTVYLYSFNINAAF